MVSEVNLVLLACLYLIPFGCIKHHKEVDDSLERAEALSWSLIRELCAQGLHYLIHYFNVKNRYKHISDKKRKKITESSVNHWSIKTSDLKDFAFHF